MGQKIHPNIFRLKNGQPWKANWFARKKDMAIYIQSDYTIRKFLTKKFKDAELDKVVIERLGKKIIIYIHTGKPGIIIGRSGENIEKLKNELEKKFATLFEIHTKEIRTSEFSAAIQARNICNMLERRITFRRAGKGIVEKIMQKGARGVKVRIAGRLGGADIARAEVFKDGDIPLSTIRADIDYAHDEAITTFGILGVKVWINKGEFVKETLK